MGNKSKISETKIANIRRLKEFGYTVKRIAELTGVSMVTVNDYTLPGSYEGRLKRSRDYLRRTILGTGSTKQSRVVHKHLNKRPYPECCELCGRTGTMLYYHHWDEENLSLGTWVCFKCHRLAELVDKLSPTGVVELMAVYVKLKREIESTEEAKGKVSSKHEGESYA